MAHESLPPAVQELYPWNGRYLALESGPRMHYLDVGTGETLLFLHGNPTWSFYWRNLIHEFSSKYRCIAPDHVAMDLKVRCVTVPRSEGCEYSRVTVTTPSRCV